MACGTPGPQQAGNPHLPDARTMRTKMQLYGHAGPQKVLPTLLSRPTSGLHHARPCADAQLLNCLPPPPSRPSRLQPAGRPDKRAMSSREPSTQRHKKVGHLDTPTPPRPVLLLTKTRENLSYVILKSNRARWARTSTVDPGRFQMPGHRLCLRGVWPERAPRPTHMAAVPRTLPAPAVALMTIESNDHVMKKLVKGILAR